VPPNPPIRIALMEAPSPSHEVSAKDVTASNGHAYRLYLAVPHDRPATGLDVLLDGNAAFGALTPDDLAASPDRAVLGIGYRTEAGFDFDARRSDYLPSDADDFGRVLFREILPDVTSTLGLSDHRHALWGHSYGALFVLHALLRKPSPIAHFWAASPSLWWNEGALIATLAEAELPQGSVTLSRGRSEHRRGTVPDENEGLYRALVDLLRREETLTLTEQVYAGAVHRDAFDLAARQFVREGASRR